MQKRLPSVRADPPGRRVTRRLDVGLGPDTAATQPGGVALRPPRWVIWLECFATGKRGMLFPTFLPRFRLAFREIPGTIPPCAGTADWRVIPMAAGSRARPGEVASPAAVSRGVTLGVTARLPDATGSLKLIARC